LKISYTTAKPTAFSCSCTWYQSEI